MSEKQDNERIILTWNKLHSQPREWTGCVLNSCFGIS